MNIKLTISDGVVKIPENVTNVTIDKNEKIFYFDVSPKNPVFSNDEYGVLFNKNKTKLIQGVHGLEEYRIPSTVKEIGEEAFYCNYSDKCDVHIIISEGVEIIGNYAFGSVSGNIDLPESVTSLGTLFCNGSFRVGKNVSYIAEGVSLSNDPVSVEPENSWFTIYNDALYTKDMTRLLYVFSEEDIYNIPEGVKQIDKYAFCNNFRVKELYIPASVEFIGDPFANSFCEAIYVSPDNQNYCDEDGILYTKDMTILLKYSSMMIGDYYMPDTVRRCSDWAFEDAEIDNLYISKNLEELSTEEFLNINEVYGIEECFGVKEKMKYEKYKNCRLYKRRN